MSDNRMNYSIDKQMQFPLVDIELEPGEKGIYSTWKHGLSFN